MERPTILTDAEMIRLDSIRQTHEHPVMLTDTDSPARLLNTLLLRHKQRGELLGLVDKLLAGVTKLKNDNGELRPRNQALRAEGMGVAMVNLRGELHDVRVELHDTKAKLDHALKGLAQANGRELRAIKHSDLPRYNVEVKPEYLHADFRAPAMRALSTIPAKIMNLADLVERYNQVVAAVADDNGEG